MTVRMPSPEEVPPPGGRTFKVQRWRGTRRYFWPRLFVDVARWKEIQLDITPGAYWCRYCAVRVAMVWGYNWLVWEWWRERRPDA